MLREYIGRMTGRMEKEDRGLDSLLARFDQQTLDLDGLIFADDASAPRGSFSRPVPPKYHFMSTMSPLKQMRLLPTMVGMNRALERSSGYFRQTYLPKRKQATRAEIEELALLGRRMGATAVGFARIPRRCIFKEKAVPCEYAILFTVEMDKEKINTAPSYRAMAEVVKSYVDLAKIANAFTDYLREKGFSAYPGTAVGGLTDYALLAREAGLGEIGFHGMLISPHGGTRQRINVVYTNVSNLPLIEANPHTWVRDLCAMCRKCVRECPSSALLAVQTPDESGRISCVDHDACQPQFAAEYGCAICIRVCPFSQIPYHEIKDRFRGTKARRRYG